MRRPPLVMAFCAVLFAAAGCAEPYEARMKFLDKMTASGIEYRTQLMEQGTPISADACGIGYELLDPDIPSDADGGATTPKWREQVEEAYLKGCLTGQERPKPEPEGVDAVDAVPHTSTPASPTSTPTGRTRAPYLPNL